MRRPWPRRSSRSPPRSNLCAAQNKISSELRTEKVANVALKSELRGNLDHYLKELRDESQGYINDNMRLRSMVHTFHALHPSHCPGCRAGPASAPVCPACIHIMADAEMMPPVVFPVLPLRW